MSKLKIFQEGVEHGKKGGGDRFGEWLEGFGADHKLFYNLMLKPVDFSVESNEKLFTDRDEIIQNIAIAIGNHQDDPHNIVLTITGVSDMGKSSLLRMLYRLAEQTIPDGEKKVIWTDVRELMEDNDDGPYIDRWLKQIKNQKIVFLDSCEQEQEHCHYILKRIKEKANQTLIIIAWGELEKAQFITDHPEYEDMLDHHNNCLRLAPMEKSEVADLISRRWDAVSGGKGKKPYTNSALEKIAEISQGIPGIGLDLFYHSLRDIHARNHDKITNDVIHSVAKYKGYTRVEASISELNAVAMHVLTILLSKPKFHGYHAAQLARATDNDRTNIVYHLSKMTDNGLLMKQQIGRHTYYNIKKHVKPLVEQQVIHFRGDYYG